MIATPTILRAFNPGLYDALEPYRVTDTALLPEEYRAGARPLHDDWAVFRDTPRLVTARRVPLPFRQTKGACEKRWMLWDPSYPAPPGLQVMDLPIWDGAKNQVLPHALVDCAAEGAGEARFEAYLNGAWVHVFTSYRKVVLGRLLAAYSGGLKQDLTVGFHSDGSLKSDVMGWWDPPSLSWNRMPA